MTSPPRIAMLLLGLVGIGASHAVPAVTQAVQPLDAKVVTTELDTDIFVGIRPSSDGEWIAFDVADGRESLTFEYPSQSFTHSGYSMWSSLSMYRLRLLSVKTHQYAAVDSPRSVSWGGSWSPDGTHYAFYSDRSGAAALWIWDRDSNSVRQVSTEIARMFRNLDAPIWTHDGKRIIYRTLPEGSSIADFERMAPDYRKAQRAVADSAASNDVVRANVYRALRDGSPAENSEGTSWFWDYRYLADLVIADIDTGAVTRLARRVRPLFAALSPNGKDVAVLNAVAAVADTQLLKTRLEVYSLRGGVSRVLDTDVIPEDPAKLSWSPRSDQIAYATREASALDTPASYVVNVRTGKKVNVTRAIIPRPQSLRRGSPLWSRDGQHLYILDTPEPSSRTGTSHLWAVSRDGGEVREVGAIEEHRIDDIVRDTTGNTYWSPDSGASLILRTHALQSKQEGFYRLALGTNLTTRLYEDDISIRAPVVGTDIAQNQFVFFREDASHAVEAFSLEIDSGRTIQLTDLHPDLSKTSLGKTRLVHWLSEQGDTLQGTLLLPPDYIDGQLLPLVVWIYGGEMGSDALNRFGFGWSSMFNMQMLATRGYAVLYPDAPAHMGSPTQDAVSAVIPGINSLIDGKIVDPTRLAVMGQSFGGYCALALITHSTRFKAAVITGPGPADLFEGYSHFSNGSDAGIGYYERGQGGIGGTPWQLPELYRENSPAFYLDRVHTPLLIERGTEDSISEAIGSVFNCLKRLGNPVELIEYEQEGHVLQKPGDIADFWDRRIQFFKSYLN